MNKEEISYRKVFEVVINYGQALLNLPNFVVSIMSDFELSIINAARFFVSVEKVKCCFFHLSQSVFRYIQKQGLVGHFRAEDGVFKTATHMMCVLSFVPLIHVKTFFLEHIPEEFVPIYEYFGHTYIRGPLVLMDVIYLGATHRIYGICTMLFY